MKTIKHVMIDIETLSTEPNAVVISIGALHFDSFTGAELSKFYVELEPSDQRNRHCSVDTVLWWMNNQAEKGVFAEGNTKTPVKSALELLSIYLNDTVSEDEELALWCCDPDFDLVILGNLYKQFSIKTPWKYNNGKSVRTIRMFSKELGITETKQEASHNAYEDCVRQAKEVSNFYRHIFKANTNE